MIQKLSGEIMKNKGIDETSYYEMGMVNAEGGAPQSTNVTF
jgi:hypothetical protein